MTEPAGRFTEILEAAGAKRPVLRCRRLVLKVSSGPDAGAKLASSADRITIGTLEGNDLVLADRSVSRFHAELLRAEDGYRLRDLGSTNGTFVGNLRVVEALLDQEATLRVGGTTLRLAPSRERDDVPLHPDPHFGTLIGRSAVMRALFAQLDRLAATGATVLVEGESGTGKELVARALHDRGPRARGPLVVVDCGSIPAELAESELFGHERGAFTGASTERAGAFETAHGGTLLLDEVGELPVALQPKLLRAIESRQVKRVGADRHREVDVRFVAATHRDLRESVNRGQFREDLYFRLAVAVVRVPPLRERLEDLPLLLDALWKQALGDLGLPDRPMPAPAPETIAELARMPWDGNVRELRNFVEQSLALAGDLDATLLAAPPASGPRPAELRLDLAFGEAKEVWVADFERAYLAERLRRAEGNVSRMAREARMDRAHAIKLLHRHGLR